MQERILQDNIAVNKQRILEMVVRAVEGRNNREGIFQYDLVPPEESFIKISKDIESETGYKSFALHSTFYAAMTTYAGNSEEQYKYIAKEKKIKNNAFIFIPDEIVKMDETALKDKLNSFF